MRATARPLALLALVLCGCQPAPPREALDDEAMQSGARRLAAVAAQGELFTQEVAARDVNDAFAWVHQQALAGEAQEIASDLARPAPPALQPAQRGALLLDADLQLAVNRIAPAQHDPAALTALAGRFAGLRAAAQRLEHAP